MKKQLETEVLIIGGGITGTGIARELSKYKVETILVEKDGHIGSGQSKASQGMIYGEGLLGLFGLIAESMGDPNIQSDNPESTRMKLRKEGVAKWPQLLDDLNIEYEDESVLVVATNKNEYANLAPFLTVGNRVGGKYANVRWVDKEAVFALQPYITKDVIAGVYSEWDAIKTHPWDLTIALMENAQQNGARIILDAEVTGVTQKNGYQLVETKQGPVKTKFVVNAAGLFADVVADMGGDRDWGLQHARNTLVILDRRVSHYVNCTVMTPAGLQEFAVITRYLGGNILINAGHMTEAHGKFDTGSRRDELLENIQLAKRLIPSISEKDIIRAYSAIPASNTRNPGEHVIEPSSTNPKFINVAIRLPGLAPSPAIAEYVVKQLGDAGLELTTKSDFNPYRKAILRFRDLSDDAKAKLISQDPRYGNVICRCETVTEGEIVRAIERGARTVAGVKYMTRAGMGRCQSGFCGPRIVNIIARELNIPVTKVTELGTDSTVVPYKSKGLLERKAVR